MSKKMLVLGMIVIMILRIDFEVLAQKEVIREEELLFMDLEVITASKFVEKLSDAPGVISVVTKDELERFGGTTLRDILLRVPSLSLSSCYMTDRSMISVRGEQYTTTSNHVLLLINGRPVREIQEGGIKSETLESFPVNIIERIEVIKGPGSVLYGSGAFSGVINIITEKAEKNGITITGLGGEKGAYGTLAEAKYRFGDLSIVVAGRYHKKPDWETNWYWWDRWDTEKGITAGFIDSSPVNIPNEGPGVYLGVNYKNLSFMSSYNQWKNAHFIPEYMKEFNSYGINDTWEKGFADLGYALKVKEKWNMDINLTYTYCTFENYDWPNIRRDSYEVGVECANSIQPTEEFKIIFGGLYYYDKAHERFKDSGLIVSDDHQSRYGFYFQTDYWLQKYMKLIGGLQANKVERIDLDIVPRAGIILYPVSDINVKVLFSQAFQAPSINQIGLSHEGLHGNPNLKCEKVNTFDIGVNYLGKKIQGGVNYFFSKLTDVVLEDRSFTKFPNYPTYDNIGEMEIQGVELEVKCYIKRNFFLTGSALYQTNKDKEGNENVTPISNFGAKTGISYKSEKGVTLSLFNIYQGDVDKKYDTPQEIPSPKAYNLMNLHCRFNMNKLFDWIFSQNLSLLLQVDNLLDKEIWFPNWGLLPGNSLPIEQGRTIYFGVEVSL